MESVDSTGDDSTGEDSAGEDTDEEASIALDSTAPADSTAEEDSTGEVSAGEDSTGEFSAGEDSTGETSVEILETTETASAAASNSASIWATFSGNWLSEVEGLWSSAACNRASLAIQLTVTKPIRRPSGVV